jgi:tRNA (guanine37-N1)-methyltransferase
MKFDIITIFPEIFNSYFNESILARAKKEKLIDINTHNLRDYAEDKHQTVDDTPYGGGAGMVMKVEPIHKAVEVIKNDNKNKKTRIILFAAKGKKYTQRDAERLAKYDNLIMICGRYEGVDERVVENIADEEISIGEYVLTGGEIPAMAVVDSISRLVPGVLGNPESLSEESFSIGDSSSDKEYPQYTKPEEFNNWKVPKILTSGDHEKIKKWREESR